MSIYVGCCGFSLSRSKYYITFNAIELQETFYEPPNPAKLRRLRIEAPPDFNFTMKCWQAVTHSVDSPTWKRSKVKPSPLKRESYGFLRPTKEVIDAWESVVEGAKTLNAKVIIVQTPPSFNFNEENFRNANDFFSIATNSGFVIGWEPRGTWLDNVDKVAELIGRFKNLIHVVDPLKRKPTLYRDVSYFRLHGLGGELNYRYRYSDDDLNELCMVVKETKMRSKEIYVMFNNVYMVQDALRFKQRFS